MTRDALVVLLRARGFVAMSRDGAMGETVLVTHDRLRSVNSGIVSYSDAAYVRQDREGRWTMTDERFAEHQLDTVEDVLAECERRFLSAEAAVSYLKENAPTAATFTLSITDTFTFAGRPDTIGAGMAAVLDALLEYGYMPDGYEQKPGARLYRYRRSCSP